MSFRSRTPRSARCAAPAALAVLALLSMLSPGCPRTAPATPPASEKKEAPPVKVAPVEMKSMPVELENVATVEAISTVEIKAQVSGEVTEILFKEGDAVTEGQELFRIDPRPFEANLKQLEAKLARAKAMREAARAEVARNAAEAENMRVELDRNKTLLEKDMVTRAEYDTARTQANASAASVNASEADARSAAEDIRAAEADIERARLDLAYCVLRSPLTGRAGALQIHKGDIVRAADTLAMVTITQLKPIYVSFTLPERYLLDVRERMAQGALPVRAAVPENNRAPAAGVLTFVDNTVDRTTSTIRLKATFPNDDELLWPGQYVRAAVEMSMVDNALVVPAQAVQSGQMGLYVYVVNAQMKTELRPVKTGTRKDGLIVITEGVNAGEQVIIDGHMRTAPDMQVSIATEAQPAAGAAK